MNWKEIIMPYSFSNLGVIRLRFRDHIRHMQIYNKATIKGWDHKQKQLTKLDYIWN